MKAIKNGISLKLQWILLFIPFINMLQKFGFTMVE